MSERFVAQTAALGVAARALVVDKAMRYAQVVTLILLGAGLLSGVGVLAFSRLRRKSDAERERERRLRINAVGRICDGTIELLEEPRENGQPRLLHYTYSVGGVNYEAAQDVAPLGYRVKSENCGEGVPASVKYDPQNPSNSIVISELWSGLRC